MIRIKSIYSITMLFMVLIMLTGCSKASSGEIGKEQAKNLNSYKLTEIGTIEDPEKNFHFSDGIYVKEEDNYNLYDYKGKDTGRSYLDISALDDGFYYGLDNYYTVAKEGNYPNIYGLVDYEGAEIIPCEAAIIKALSDRYLAVTYGTEETSDEDEALFYATSGYGIALVGPNDDDTLYKGYTQVYDLKNKKMVSNIKSESNTEKLEVFGEDICWSKDDGVTEVYDADGNMIITNKDINDYIEIRNGLIELDNKVYNEKGEEITGMRNGLKPTLIQGNNQYILYKETKNNKEYSTVVDIDGNAVIENSEKSISDINDDVVCFYIHEGDKSLYGLMTLQGDEIVAPSECTYQYCKYGYWCRTNSDNTKDVISKNGVIATNVKNISSLIYEIDGTTEYVILNDKNKTVDLREENVQKITDTIVLVKQNDLCGIIDLYTGEQLLDYEYDSITYTANCIYAYKDNVWTIFEISNK